jgi:hypothetical protein
MRPLHGWLMCVLHIRAGLVGKTASFLFRAGPDREGAPPLAAQIITRLVPGFGGQLSTQNCNSAARETSAAHALSLNRKATLKSVRSKLHEGRGGLMRAVLGGPASSPAPFRIQCPVSPYWNSINLQRCLTNNTIRSPLTAT